MRSVFGVLAGVAASVVFFTGCEGGGGGGDDGNTSVVGSWALYSGRTIEGSPSWYAHFNADLSFTISDNSDGSAVRVSGTYTVSDDSLVGPFTNPGVGEGRVEATLTDGTMELDFIEYWHTPNKVVPYIGTRL